MWLGGRLLCNSIPFVSFIVGFVFVGRGWGYGEGSRGVPRYMVRAEVVDDGEVFLGF